MTKLGFSVRDYSDEYSSTTLNIPDVTAANFDATITSINGINTAIDALTLVNITRVDLALETGLAGADIRPSNPFAQREIGLRFFYQDTVNGQKYNFTVPCADLSLVAQAGTDDVDLTLSIVAPVVTSIEALIVSPDGNPIVINRGQVVGRKS